jgi:hypothetical protein
MQNSILLNNISAEELISLFESLRNEIQDIKQNLEPKLPAEYIARLELSKMLDVDISTIHNWTVKGILKKHCIGNRVYYKRSEIEEALVKIDFKKNA